MNISLVCLLISANKMKVLAASITQKEIIPIPLNLFPPQSYAREVRTNKICAGIVILYLTNLCRYYFSDKLPRASLKGLHPSLLILTIEQLLSSINALPLSLLTLAEWEIT